MNLTTYAIVLLILLSFPDRSIAQSKHRLKFSKCEKALAKLLPKEARVKIADIGNMVTLGDAGEALDWDAAMAPYKYDIQFFEDHFDDEQLIDIINSNLCPKVTASAFTALMQDRPSNITDEMIKNLLMNYVTDTVTMVFEDHGCFAIPLPLFDYMLSIANSAYFPIFIALHEFDESIVEDLLELRKPYYNPDADYNSGFSWDQYVKGFKPSEPW